MFFLPVRALSSTLLIQREPRYRVQASNNCSLNKIAIDVVGVESAEVTHEKLYASDQRAYHLSQWLRLKMKGLPLWTDGFVFASQISIMSKD